MQNSRSGFSIIKVIVIVVILAGLGVGGYFAYSKFIAPMLNPYSKYVPEGLADYATGDNADAVAFIKIDPALAEQIAKIPTQNLLSEMTGAVILGQSAKQTATMIIGFKSAAGAQSLKTFLETQLIVPGMSAPSFELKDKVLIVSIGGGYKVFTGSLFNNPILSTLDPTMSDSQVILAVNNYKAAEVNLLFYAMINTVLGGSGNLYSSLPVAHAQGLIDDTSVNPKFISEAVSSGPSPQALAAQALNALLVMTKNTVLYAGIKDGIISVRLDMDIMEKSELAGSSMATVGKTMAPGMDSATVITEFTNQYDETLQTLSGKVAELQKTLNEDAQAIPGLKQSMSFANKRFQFTISIPLAIIETTIKAATEGAPKKGKDSARKAAIVSIVTAVEAHYLEKGSYPDTSACVDTITSLDTYFQGAKQPKDPNGEQSFGDIKCAGGYYYQYIKDKGYAVWAKMELPESGNISITPTEFEKLVNEGKLPKEETSGTYYLENQMLTYDPNAPIKITVTTIAKNKIKLVYSRPLDSLPYTSSYKIVEKDNPKNTLKIKSMGGCTSSQCLSTVNELSETIETVEDLKPIEYILTNETRKDNDGTLIKFDPITFSGKILDTSLPGDLVEMPLTQAYTQETQATDTPKKVKRATTTTTTQQ